MAGSNNAERVDICLTALDRLRVLVEDWKSDSRMLLQVRREAIEKLEAEPTQSQLQDLIGNEAVILKRGEAAFKLIEVIIQLFESVQENTL